jgi:hypothetical protein
VIRTQKGVAWHSKKCSEFAARVHRVLLSCHVPLLTTAAPCRPPLHSVSGSRRSLHLAGQAIANDQPPTCLAGQSPGASVPGRRCSAREPGGAVGRGHGPRARRPPPPPRVHVRRAPPRVDFSCYTSTIHAALAAFCTRTVHVPYLPWSNQWNAHPRPDGEQRELPIFPPARVACGAYSVRRPALLEPAAYAIVVVVVVTYAQHRH